MKKLLLLAIVVCSYAHADKKQPEEAPLPPPPKAVDELNNNESPEDLLEKIKDVESRAKKTEEDFAKLGEDHEKTLKNLKDRKEDIAKLTDQITELQKLVAEQAESLELGPGSLFKGWVYSPELKWVYTSPTIAPYSYSQNHGWMLYKLGSDPRLVYYYNTKEWEELRKNAPGNDKGGR
jgi:hypothetical protein